jgi:ribosome-binding protein aMBF1 (putative translation factor)
METATSETKALVYNFDSYANQSPDVSQGHQSIGALISKWEKDDKRKAALSEARQWLVGTFYNHEAETIKTLRLKKGWSQSHLADLLSTAQSYIARIENNPVDLHIETCRRLCTVFEIDMNTLDTLLLKQSQLSKQGLRK